MRSSVDWNGPKVEKCCPGSRWRVHAVPAFLFVLGYIVAGCDAAPADHSFTLGGQPRLVAEEQLRIGGPEGSEEAFDRISAVDMDDAGNIYILDGRRRQIRVHDRAGGLVRRIGRRGEEPGEFAGALDFGVVSDTIWVYDDVLRRITLLDRDGSILSTATLADARVALPGQYGLIVPLAMKPGGKFSSRLGAVRPDTDGRLVGIGHGDSIPVPRLVFGACGSVVDTAGWDPAPPPGYLPDPAPEESVPAVHVGDRMYTVPRPPPYTEQWVPLSDGRLVVAGPEPVDSDTSLLVTRLDMAGDTVYHRRYSYQPRRYSDTYLDSLAMRRARVPSGMAVTGDDAGERPVMMTDPAAMEAIRAAMDFPEFRLPFRYIHLGDDGAPWILRGDTEYRSDHWLVLDPDGLPVGNLELPRQVQVLWSRGDTFLAAVQVGEYDTPWLVKYRMELFDR